MGSGVKEQYHNPFPLRYFQQKFGGSSRDFSHKVYNKFASVVPGPRQERAKFLKFLAEVNVEAPPFLPQ